MFYAANENNSLGDSLGVPIIDTRVQCIDLCSTTEGCVAIDYREQDSRCFLLSQAQEGGALAQDGIEIAVLQTTTSTSTTTSPPPSTTTTTAAARRGLHRRR